MPSAARSSGSGWRIAPTGGSRRCPAGSNSALSSPRPSLQSRTCSCSTSRPPASTPRRRRRSRRCSRSSAEISLSRSCTSRTSSAPSSISSSDSCWSGARSSSTGPRPICPASGTTPPTPMLDLEFMRLAFGAGIVVGLLAPAVGFFLVQRRLSLIGDGIGHVAFAGVALGYLLDFPLILTALVVSVLGALAIELLRARRRTAGDQALALVFYTGIAGGVVLVSVAGALNVNLFQFLFGSILTVTRHDFVVIAALGVASLLVILVLYRPLVATVVDEESARVAGLPVPALNVLTAVLAAVTIAGSMRVVGILLIAALMVLPVIAGGRLAWSMASTVFLSMLVGLGSVLAGITIAYYADFPPGATTVLVAAAVALVAMPLGALVR